MRAKFGVPEALSFIGALAMIVGVFLNYNDGSSFIDYTDLGVPLFLVAALLLWGICR